MLALEIAPDDDDAALARVAGLPLAARSLLDVRLHAVHDLAPRLAGERQDRLDAKHVGRVEHEQPAEPALEASRIEVARQLEREDLDVEVLVAVLVPAARVLGVGAEGELVEQQRHVELVARGGDDRRLRVERERSCSHLVDGLALGEVDLADDDMRRELQLLARLRALDAVEPKPRTAAERPGGRCPDKGEATWVQTGKQQLRVRGGGRWSVVVEQQVDTPLHEPALPSMRASGTRVLASGSFYPVERKGTGRARLYRLADGRGALRLDPFRTSSNTDLYVWFSTAPRPKTTKQVVAARRLGPLLPLKSTIGEQNYVLPRSVDPRRVRSIVIWCVPVQIVYTVAGLS